MNRWLAPILALVALGALALRLPELDRRPLHHDEAVNAILFQRLWERGEYRYNPDEYHGPTLHYATLPFVWLSGAPDFDHLSERTLRWSTVAAGVALVLLVGLLRDALGTVATAASAALLALSPAMVFYSRYFIHEILLVCFTLLFLGAAWRHRQTRHVGWAALAGAALGLIYATKETSVLTVATMGFAAAGTLAWNRWRDGTRWAWPPELPPRHLAVAVGVALAIALLLFTSFFTNLRGPLDSLATYFPWLHRAGGHSPHIHPWHFYFERLLAYHAHRGPWWSEALIALLALVGLTATRNRTGDVRTPSARPWSVGFARFLTLYTLAITAAYCAIPYKTPWCLLNFWLPTILLAGLGVSALLGSRAARSPLSAHPPRPIGPMGPMGPMGPSGRDRFLSASAKRCRIWATAVLLAAGAAHLGAQAWRTSHTLATHRGNPYIYSQTVPNAVELADRVKAIAAASPDGVRTPIKVIAPDSGYWPLPWYLRQLRSVWWLDAMPEDPYAPMTLVATKLQASLDEKSNRRYLSVGYYELRPSEFFELYVEYGLWKHYLETRPRPKDDE